MKKNLLLLFLLITVPFVLNAKQFVVVSSGIGSSLEEAQNKALIEAVKQATGTVMSESSAVLNDELLSDQVSSFTKGKVMKYKVISSQVNPVNGQCEVTLEVTVESEKLLNYTSATGSTAQVNGAAFVINRRIMRMQTENEILMVKDLLTRMYDQRAYIYDLEVTASDPQFNTDSKKYDIKVNVKVKEGKAYDAYKKMNKETLKSLSLNSDDRKEYKSFYNADPYKYDGYYFRHKDTAEILRQWEGRLYSAGKCSFTLEDNLGNKKESPNKPLNTYTFIFSYTEQELGQFAGYNAVPNPNAALPDTYYSGISWYPATYMK